MKHWCSLVQCDTGDLWGRRVGCRLSTFTGDPTVELTGLRARRDCLGFVHRSKTISVAQCQNLTMRILFHVYVDGVFFAAGGGARGAGEREGRREAGGSEPGRGECRPINVNSFLQKHSYRELSKKQTGEPRAVPGRGRGGHGTRGASNNSVAHHAALPHPGTRATGVCGQCETLRLNWDPIFNGTPVHHLVPKSTRFRVVSFTLGGGGAAFRSRREGETECGATPLRLECAQLSVCEAWRC